MEVTTVTEPAIDEAAAVAWANVVLAGVSHRDSIRPTDNLARAALRWKARAEAAEAERDSLRRQLTSLSSQNRNRVESKETS